MNKQSNQPSRSKTRFSLRDFVPKQRKGADKILAIYWFLILVLVAGGIFLMVYTFYHHPIDVRKLEASILANKVADCLSREGLLGSDIMQLKPGSTGDYEFNPDFKEESNFLNYCNLIFEGEKERGWDTEIQYALNILFYHIGVSAPFDEVSFGNVNYFSSCETKDKDDKNFRKLPPCIYRGLYAVGPDGGQFLIQIISIVNKAEKNVK